MTPLDTLVRQAWAVVAAVADGRRRDAVALLDDLPREDLTAIITVMANVMIDGHVGTSPEGRALLAEVTRAHLLDLAAREGQADDGG
ncbi:hypothetical protein [Streptomyces sp. C1-2]|uniref:hypothetical protein n=1 Tax=Streptomyces sp. C1-2 TaxID=2720022 RepID=UPI0014326FB0|nr:hypothetical protein [Streptomyces sp. C1-2]NJP72166.1 hypothetical protein [Streptomyces sp. C1-2]